MKLSKKAIYLIIAFMVVGFSVTATVLFVNGGARIASLEEDFDIYFSSAVLDGVDKSNIFITSDKKHITFETNKLKHVNDTSVLEFEVTNNSTQYDAEVVISCVTDNQEYISLETDKENYIISAQTRETGTLTTRLLKVADNFINATITCTLDTSAKEREVKLEKTLVDPTYQITGTLKNEDNVTLKNKNLVVFSDEPHYVTTDDFGFFYVSGLEKGEHEIYYVGDIDVIEKTKEEIKELSSDKTKVYTDSNTVNFKKIELDGSVIEPDRTGKVEINYDTNGGDSLEDSKRIILYDRAGDLPIPTRYGYRFKGWKRDGKIISSNTIIIDNQILIAEWEQAFYNATSSKKSATPVYHQHSGDEINGGKCYQTPVYHVHTDACYQTHYCGGEVYVYYSSHQDWGWNAHSKCNRCGKIYANQGTINDPNAEDPMGKFAGYCYNATGKELICDKEGTIESYQLSCTKDENTIDGYKCNDGYELSGDECIKYSCPNGGTLDGTTCVF